MQTQEASPRPVSITAKRLDNLFEQGSGEVFFTQIGFTCIHFFFSVEDFLFKENINVKTIFT